MKRGDTLAVPFAHKDANGAAIDITSWLLWFTVKKNVQDPDALALYATRSDAASPGVAVVSGPLGTLLATLPATSTLGFADGPIALVYDIQARDLTGAIKTLTGGSIVVTPDVTRAVS